MHTPNCLNCENPLGNDQHFCSKCGQKASLHRLSLHDVGHDALHYFTHADKGIFSLLWMLLTKPGKVQREYVAGKRKKFFPPLNFLLIVAAFYVFMMSIVMPATRESIISKEETARYEKIQDPVLKAKVSAILERRVKSMQLMNKYSNIVTMIATPLISLLFWLFYVKGRYNYTEHLVANMYTSGFTVLCFALLFGPLTMLFNQKGIGSILISFFVFEIAYRSVSYYHFMNKGTRASAVKATLVSVFVLLVWFTITSSLVALYIWNGFFGLFE